MAFHLQCRQHVKEHNHNSIWDITQVAATDGAVLVGGVAGAVGGWEGFGPETGADSMGGFDLGSGCLGSDGSGAEGFWLG